MTTPDPILDAAEQLQAVTAERDELQRIDAVRLDQIKTLQDIIRCDLTPAGIEVAQWRAERDQLRAQRDALLAVLESGQSLRTHDLDMTQRWVIDDVDEVREAIRNCKETNQ